MVICTKCGAEDLRSEDELRKAPACLVCGAKFPEAKLLIHEGNTERDEHGITEYDRESNFGCW